MSSPRSSTSWTRSRRACRQGDRRRSKKRCESEWERPRQSVHAAPSSPDEAIAAPNCSLVFAGADELPAHIKAETTRIIRVEYFNNHPRRAVEHHEIAEVERRTRLLAVVTSAILSSILAMSVQSESVDQVPILFTIPQWLWGGLSIFLIRSSFGTTQDRHVEELIALTGDYRVARAAFDEAVKCRPGRIVTLRQKTRLLADSSSNELAPVLSARSRATTLPQAPDQLDSR